MSTMIIQPQDRVIRIDDVMLVIPGDVQMPDGPVIAGFVNDPERPIRQINFDGATGIVERESRAFGRVDFEHFLGDAPLAAYVAVHAAEVARLAEAKRAQEAEAEKRAKATADAYAKAGKKDPMLPPAEG